MSEDLKVKIDDLKQQLAEAERTLASGLPAKAAEAAADGDEELSNRLYSQFEQAATTVQRLNAAVGVLQKLLDDIEIAARLKELEEKYDLRTSAAAEIITNKNRDLLERSKFITKYPVDSREEIDFMALLRNLDDAASYFSRDGLEFSRLMRIKVLVTRDLDSLKRVPPHQIDEEKINLVQVEWRAIDARLNHFIAEGEKILFERDRLKKMRDIDRENLLVIDGVRVR